MSFHELTIGRPRLQHRADYPSPTFQLELTALVFAPARAPRAFGVAFMASRRNMGLMLAATARDLPDLVWLYFALCQFPIYLLPQLLKPLARWVTHTHRSRRRYLTRARNDVRFCGRVGDRLGQNPPRPYGCISALAQTAEGAVQVRGQAHRANPVGIRPRT
jgi:BASS family bile acid:Na+ symporter